MEAAILIREGDILQRVENQKPEHFNNFSTNINTDVVNGNEEDRLQSDGEIIGEWAKGKEFGPIPENASTVNNQSNQNP